MTLKQITQNIGRKLQQIQNENADKRNILLLIGSILLCESVGIISIFTSKFIISDVSLVWYGDLLKPVFNVSVHLFQGIWLIMYLLTGLSLYLVLNSENINQEALLKKLKKIGIDMEPWSGKKNPNNKKHALILFGIQLILSALLVPVFFGLRSTLGGFVVAILLCICIYLMLYKFYKVTAPSSLLLVPPALWASYLVGLNFTFWIFNNTPWVIWSSTHKLF